MSDEPWEINPNELEQWRETIRLDVIWAARLARFQGWVATDPGSVVRGICAVRVQGLGEREANRLLPDLEGDDAFFFAMRDEYRLAYEQAGE